MQYCGWTSSSVSCRTLLNFDTSLLCGFSCFLLELPWKKIFNIPQGFNSFSWPMWHVVFYLRVFFLSITKTEFLLAFPVCLFWEQIPRNSGVHLHLLTAPCAPSHIFQGTGFMLPALQQGLEQHSWWWAVLKFAVLAKSKELCPLGCSCAMVLAQAGTMARSSAWGNDLCRGTETNLCALCSPAWPAGEGAVQAGQACMELFIQV